MWRLLHKKSFGLNKSTPTVLLLRLWSLDEFTTIINAEYSIVVYRLRRVNGDNANILQNVSLKPMSTPDQFRKYRDELLRKSK